MTIELVADLNGNVAADAVDLDCRQLDDVGRSRSGLIRNPS
ncbi:MAG TPA: hypothetical protein VF221_13230 [Chloroflexota bacterium]